MIMTFENLPTQRFSTVIKDIDYTFEVNYNSLYGFWVIDIESNDFKILGIKLVAGINLVEQYVQVPFTMKSLNTDDPTRDSLNLFKLEVL